MFHASIQLLSVATQQPIEKVKRSSSNSERSEECIETIEAHASIRRHAVVTQSPIEMQKTVVECFERSEKRIETTIRTA